MKFLSLLKCQSKFVQTNKLLSVNYIIRKSASQLYPTTSERLDETMLQAVSVATKGAEGFSGLQNYISGEFVNITKYLERLVGVNHPIIETAKRCSYIAEGKMGSPQARGLVVLLMAKATESLIKPSKYRQTRENILKSQQSLAEMTELTYSAYMIHRGVMDLTIRLPEEDHNEASSDPLSPEIKAAKKIHYGNKISILCGDFLLAHVMRGLGEMFSSKAVDLIASAITSFMNGEFLLIDDWRSENFLLKSNARDLERWVRRSYSSIGILQGNTCQGALLLGGIGDEFQARANEFGKNLGLAWQAHTELQPFLKSKYEPVQLPDLSPFPSFDLNSLPVINFLKHSLIKLDDIRAKKPEAWDVNFQQHNHQDSIDYEKLHGMIVSDCFAIYDTMKMIEEYSLAAREQLSYFPESPAKEILGKICLSLHE